MSHFIHLIISENSGHHSDSILALLQTVCGLEERGGAQFVGLLPRANLPFYSTRAVASCKRCVEVVEKARIAASLASWRARCASHAHARRERRENGDKEHK